MRLILTGASGQLGAYLVDRIIHAGHELIAWSGSAEGARGGVPLIPVDLSNAEAIRQSLEQADPQAILHVAALARPEVAFREPARAWAVNTHATSLLADWCLRHDRRLVFTSTDLAFDGTRPWLVEEDPPCPVMVYARTKVEAESFVTAAPRGLVARITLQFGPSRTGTESAFDRSLAALRRGESQTYFVDEFRTPLDFASTADALVRLVESEATGILHVGGLERVSRYELMRRIATALGLDSTLIRGNRQSEITFSEPRPLDVSLNTTKLTALLPDLSRSTIEQAAHSWAEESGARASSRRLGSSPD